MNMIMGPNGTGKSTIVAAIALGLGANPSVLGRSKNPTDFIKYNEGHASIELVLKCERPESDKSRGYVVIKRVMNRVSESECDSDFFINGNASSQRAVVQLASELGAQITNLCQFLPQDKVSEFAQMSPAQMLVATMAAAASEETCLQHTKLIDIRKNDRKVEEALEKDLKEKEMNQRVLEGLKTQMLRAKERESRLKKIALMEKKLPWLQYQRDRQRFIDFKATRDRLRKELEAATMETNQELGNRIESATSRVKDAEKKQKTSGKRLQTSRMEIEKLSENVSGLSVSIQSKKRDILRERGSRDKMREECANLRAEITKLEEAIHQAQNRITAPATDPEVLNREIQQINKEIGRYDSKIDELNTKEEEIATYSKRLRDIEVRTASQISNSSSGKAQRLEALSRINPAAFSAYNWLEKNRDKFYCPVIGPLGLEFSVKDEKMSRAVESVISRSILVSFVCVDARDQENFLNVCEKMNWPINCVLLQNYSKQMRPSACPWSKTELNRLGFDCVVLDLLDASVEVQVALCELSKVHLIPVALNSGSKINLLACEKVDNLMKFVSSESFFEIKKSRYNNRDVAARSAPLKPGFILSTDVGSQSELVKLREKVTAVRADLNSEQQKMRQVLEEKNGLIASIERLRSRQTECNQLHNASLNEKAALKRDIIKKEQKRSHLRELSQSISTNDHEAELLRELSDMILTRNDQIVEIGIKIKSLSQNSLKSRLEWMKKECDVAELDQLLALLNIKQAQHAALRESVRAAEIEAEEAKEQAQTSLKIAEIDQITEDIKAAFAALPEDLSELQTLIASERVQFRAAGSGDRFGETDQERLEATIHVLKELELKITENSARMESVRNELQEVARLWRGSIDEMISKVNSNFSRFFQKIGCRGEVCLIVPTEETDFDRYELAIRVSFRASEELQRLTAFRQSGGEKSVSTILYLLSLQELSKSPFRVVDEINQGMDVENERKVHSLIVDTATRGNESNQNTSGAQYFLITPKLLTGLQYHPKMHILCIYNGPGVLN